MRWFQKLDAHANRFAEQITEDANRQLRERIIALGEHYGVDFDAEPERYFAEIFRKLAADTVPGFQINVHRETRPMGSYKIGGEELFKAVNLRTQERGETVNIACLYLSRHSQKWLNHKPAALETAYYSFKKQTQEALKKLEANPVYKSMMDVFGMEEFFARMPINSKSK